MKAFAAAVVAGLACAALAGCSNAPDSAVRPLISDTTGNYVVAAYDDPAIQASLEEIVEAALTLAGDGYAAIDTDDLNELVLDTAVVEASRPVNEYGGGTEAASIDLSERRVVIAMGGVNGSCWAVRVSGPVSEPVVSRTALFSPGCSAAVVLKEQPVWTASWPARPEPASGPASGQPGAPIGPPGATDQLPDPVVPSASPQ